MPRFSGVDSEVGRLRAVIVHRPGAELKRVVPPTGGRLPFAGPPWAARAQQEHDIFTQVFVRDQSVWIGDQVAVASPAAAGRRLSAEMTGIVYAHHPLFAGTKSLYRSGLEPLHGGDLLLAASVCWAAKPQARSRDPITAL